MQLDKLAVEAWYWYIAVYSISHVTDASRVGGHMRSRSLTPPVTAEYALCEWLVDDEVRFEMNGQKIKSVAAGLHLNQLINEQTRLESEIVY